MPRPLTVQERESFLAEPHIGILSVASDSNRPPLTIPIWYAYEPGGELTFFTGTFGHKARKVDLLRKAGVLSFCVQRDEPPYKYVTVEGTMSKEDKPPSLDQVLKIVRRYLPEEQAQAFAKEQIAFIPNEFVHFTVRPDRWLTFDFGEDAA